MLKFEQHMINYLKKIQFVGAYSIPFFISSIQVLTGNIPFWYDSARDLLSALDNLNKVTLIGPTSGIPGLFYGPYWIWILSLASLVSKDPRVVTFIVQTIPFTIILPLILYRISKNFDRTSTLIVYLLFIFSSGFDYATTLWNPHLSLLFLVILIYLLIFKKNQNSKLKQLLNYSLIGFLSGMIINFHISFGIGVFLGIILYIFLVNFLPFFKNQKKLKKQFISLFFILIFFGAGVVSAFLPFIIFEIKHQFLQSKTVLNAIINYGDVVDKTGLTRQQIPESFFGQFNNLVQIKDLPGYLIESFLLILLFILILFKKIKINSSEKKLITFLFSISTAILFIYLTARNPVWDYHFIGVEIIFLFLLILIIHKIKFLKPIFLVWTIYIALSYLFPFINNNFFEKGNRVGLSEQIYFADTIDSDAGGNDYNVFIYSPSIYTYEYSYVFNWKYDKNFPYDPGQNKIKSDLVYLIIPEVNKIIHNDFVNYRTSQKEFKTVKIWNMPNNVKILKRVNVKSE